MATFVIKLSTQSNHRCLIHVVEKEDGINHISLKLHTSYDISNSLIRIRIEYDALRQKYLNRPTVNFPSSVVLNSPGDSFFFFKTLSAQSSLYNDLHSPTIAV